MRLVGGRSKGGNGCPSLQVRMQKPALALAQVQVLPWVWRDKGVQALFWVAFNHGACKDGIW